MSNVKHLKKGDLVVSLSGSEMGKTGKVLEVNQAKALVKVDGLGIVKRHSKPDRNNQKGGIVEKNKWMPACKFQVCDNSGKKLGRVGFKIVGEKKERTFSTARK
jgi:large subunit ribosomal protein L24